jgi:hypothetical protein
VPDLRGAHAHLLLRNTGSASVRASVSRDKPISDGV